MKRSLLALVLFSSSASAFELEIVVPVDPLRYVPYQPYYQPYLVPQAPAYVPREYYWQQYHLWDHHDRDYGGWDGEHRPRHHHHHHHKD